MTWKTTNGFAAQPLRCRIEALMSAAGYDSTGAVVIADFAANQSAWTQSTAAGVTFSFGSVAASTNGAEIFLTMTNGGKVAQNAAWTRLSRGFDPPLNLERQKALGFCLEGDGQGEVLAVRLESPQNIAFGAIADRYITVDFTGRRYFTLV